MKKGWASLALLALFVTVLSASDLADKTVVRAQVLSCTHRLKRLPKVRMFIGQDLNFFHNVEYVNELGAFPDLLLLNAGGDVVERTDLTEFTREEISQLLLRKGFYKKADIDEEVPEKYRQGPYVAREEL